MLELFNNDAEEKGAKTYVVDGFNDHLPLNASLMSLKAFAMTDPVGGAKT